MLFINHFCGGIDKGIKLIPGDDLFIAYIYPAFEAGYIDIDPPRVLRFIIKKSSVPYYVGIRRVFERVRIARLVERTVFFLRECDIEIPLLFIGISAVAGDQDYGND